MKLPELFDEAWWQVRKMLHSYTAPPGQYLVDGVLTPQDKEFLKSEGCAVKSLIAAAGTKVIPRDLIDIRRTQRDASFTQPSISNRDDLRHIKALFAHMVTRGIFPSGSRIVERAFRTEAEAMASMRTSRNPVIPVVDTGIPYRLFQRSHAFLARNGPGGTLFSESDGGGPVRLRPLDNGIYTALEIHIPSRLERVIRWVTETFR